MITCDYYGSVFLRENVTPQSVVENTTGAIESIGLTVTPNPFSTTTQIRYLIHDTEYLIGNATLRVYDTEGRLVKSFNTVSSVQDQESRISWSGSDDANRKLGNGVYFVTLRTNRGTLTEKILITR
jgi:flagellar hook assembly protein FlgD